MTNIANIKRSLIQVLAVCAIVLLPVTMLAQTNQGYSKKKVQPATTKSSKASGHKGKSKSSGRSHSSVPSTAMSRQERDRIIQNLISNMVYVEGGTFIMGATSEQGSDAREEEKPVHKVTLSSFSIGKYEVTQAEWEAVMGNNPSHFTGNNQRPVEQVSWNECKEFVRKLNAMTGRRFRLPTEAEWEYAARGGNRSQSYKYAGSNYQDIVAWYKNNSSPATHSVGTKSPNELGLYDMSGNVWEWCQDWYVIYSNNSQYNPTGPASGSLRVFRGGSWGGDARYCRVAYRSYYSPGSRSTDLGFRLAL